MNENKNENEKTEQVADDYDRLMYEMFEENQRLNDEAVERQLDDLLSLENKEEVLRLRKTSMENKEDVTKVMKRCKESEDFTELRDMAVFSERIRDLCGKTKQYRLDFLKECLEEYKLLNNGEEYKYFLRKSGEQRFKENLSSELNARQRDEEWSKLSREQQIQYGLRHLDETLDILADTGVPQNDGEYELIKFRNEKLAKIKKEQIKQMNQFLDGAMGDSVKSYNIVKTSLIASLFFGIPGILAIGLYAILQGRHETKKMSKILVEGLESDDPEDLYKAIKQMESYASPIIDVQKMKQTLLQSNELTKYIDNAKEIRKLQKTYQEIAEATVPQLKKDAEEAYKEEEKEQGDVELELTEMMGESDKLGL